MRNQHNELQTSNKLEKARTAETPTKRSVASLTSTHRERLIYAYSTVQDLNGPIHSTARVAAPALTSSDKEVGEPARGLDARHRAHLVPAQVGADQLARLARAHLECRCAARYQGRRRRRDVEMRACEHTSNPERPCSTRRLSKHRMSPALLFDHSTFSGALSARSQLCGSRGGRDRL